MGDDYIAFSSGGPGGPPSVYIEGVDFRSLRGKAQAWEAGKRRRKEEAAIEDEFEEEEVIEEEVVPASAPSAQAQDVEAWILAFGSELADSPVTLQSNLAEEGVDSISMSLLVNKLQTDLQVAVSIAEIAEMATVQQLVERVMERAPAPQQKVVRKVVRTRRRRKQPVPRLAKTDPDTAEWFDMEAETSQPAVGPTMEAGARVRLIGLQNSKCQGMAGALGVLVVFHYAEGRWQVRLDDHAECKLLREANLQLVDIAQAVPGLSLLRPHAGGPHVFIVQSVGHDIADKAIFEVAENFSLGHVCALLFDEEAGRCESLPNLVDLYVRRVLEEYRSKAGVMHGPVVLAGCSMGCGIAHEMAVQLDRASVAVELVLFGFDLCSPAGSSLQKEGRDWLGGTAEAVLLCARLLGASTWVELEEERLMRKDERDADDLAMRLYWDYLAPEGKSAANFQAVIKRLGDKFDKLHALLAGFRPAETFAGPISFALTEFAASAAAMDIIATDLDRLCT